tara:strand:- start:274 stop:471 length:198 start_codon:yes stop_codon:yes gene_type:complete
MCLGNQNKNRNDTPMITGSQIGVSNPIDTKKATEDLKIKRKKEDKPIKLRARSGFRVLSPFDLRL